MRRKERRNGGREKIKVKKKEVTLKVLLMLNMDKYISIAIRDF